MHPGGRGTAVVAQTAKEPSTNITASKTIVPSSGADGGGVDIDLVKAADPPVGDRQMEAWKEPKSEGAEMTSTTTTTAESITITAVSRPAKGVA